MIFRDDEKPKRRTSRGAVSVALSDGKSRKTSTAGPAGGTKSSVASSSIYGSKRASLAPNAAADRIAGPFRGRDIQVLYHLSSSLLFHVAYCKSYQQHNEEVYYHYYH